MAVPFGFPFSPALSLQGIIMPGATLTFYLSGTTTLATVYSDDANGALPNPVPTDAYGYFPNIYLSDTVLYRVVFKSDVGVVLGDMDPVGSTTSSDLAAEIASRIAGDANLQAQSDSLDTRVTTNEQNIVTLQSGSSTGGTLYYPTWASLTGSTAAYNAATAYTKGQTLVDQGVMWVNILASTAVAPPTLPTTSNANWQVFRNPLIGQAFAAPVTDTGTHTDPTDGTTKNNTGVFSWQVGTSGTGPKYLFATDAALAKVYSDAAATSASQAATSLTAVQAAMASLFLSTTVTIGRPTDPVSGSALGSNTYIFGNAVPTGSTSIQSIKLYVLGAGTFYIGRYTKSGTAVTLVASYSFSTSTTGLQTFTPTNFGSIPVNAGEFIGIYGPGLATFSGGTTADGLGYYVGPVGAPASGSVGSLTTTSRLECQVNFAANVQVVSGATFVALQNSVATQGIQVTNNTTAVNQLNTNSYQVTGRPVTPIDGTAISNNTFCPNVAIGGSGSLSSVRFYAHAAGTIAFVRYSKSGSIYTLAATSPTVTIAAAGLVTLTQTDFGAFPVNAGDYVGYFNGGVVPYTSAAPDDAGTLQMASNGTIPTTVTTPGLATTVRPEIGFTFAVPTQVVTAAAFLALQNKAAGGTPIVYLPSASKPVLLGSAGWQHVLDYGQSLSDGINAQPALSTTQPYFNLTFGSGTRSGKPGNTAGAVNTSPGTTTTKALIEENSSSGSPAADGGTNNGETICTGAASTANEFAAIEADIDPSTLIFFASAAGHTGYSILSLRKGSTWYNQLIDHVTEAKARATAAGKAYICQVMPYMQGEADAQNGNSANYKTQLEQFVADINVDIPAITGQSTPVHVLIYQTSGSNGPATRAAVEAIKQAQIDAVNETALLHFAGPIFYLTPAPDFIHITNVSQLRFGRVMGRAIKQLLVEGRVPDCVWPISATARGTKLTVKFRVPRFPLVLDTAALGVITDMGFKVVDDAGTVALANIAVGLTGDTVTMDLSRTLSTNPIVRHALDYVAPSNTFTLSASGCLRDSTTDTSVISGVTYSMWHVAPAFKLPVISLQVQS